MIKKVKNRFKVVSHTTGKSLGDYASKADAQRRLRQIRYFKSIKGYRRKPSND